ncbi:MAG: hypothetical protein EBR82_62775 [Caulobacteraceae bacterium]|nr:hypothetical protein [Caulobacteraceae bacterium]
MEALLYGNLTNGSLTETIGGTAFDWPVLTEGDTVKLALRLVARVDESELEVYPTVNTVKLSLGRVDARPTAGSFALRLRPANTNDSNDTASLAYSATDLPLPRPFVGLLRQILSSHLHGSAPIAWAGLMRTGKCD